jgi:hypothetical protein
MPSNLNDLRGNPEAYQAMEKFFSEFREHLISHNAITANQNGMFLTFKGDLPKHQIAYALMTSDELNALSQTEYEEILYIMPPPTRE